MGKFSKEGQHKVFMQNKISPCSDVNSANGNDW